MLLPLRLLSASLTQLLVLLIWASAITAHFLHRLDALDRRLSAALHRIAERWRALFSPPPLPLPVVRRRPANRTPEHIEQTLVRLHVEQPHLGTSQLRFLLQRVSSWKLARETVRKILIRRQDLVVELQQAKRRRRRRIHIRRPLQLWGADLTLVWVLGFFPVWVLGVVDYCGSRVIVLERLAAPTGTEVQRLLRRAFAEHGTPKRLLTDNGGQFTSLDFELMLSAHDVDHTRTKPAHPWTNGRIERLFQTLKQMLFLDRWLITSVRQLDTLLGDFVTFYNRDRPHSSYSGRTPDEVFFGRPPRPRPLERVSYFDGALHWYRFG